MLSRARLLAPGGGCDRAGRVAPHMRIQMHIHMHMSAYFFLFSLSLFDSSSLGGLREDGMRPAAASGVGLTGSNARRPTRGVIISIWSRGEVALALSDRRGIRLSSPLTCTIV